MYIMIYFIYSHKKINVIKLFGGCVEYKDNSVFINAELDLMYNLTELYLSKFNLKQLVNIPPNKYDDITHTSIRIQ